MFLKPKSGTEASRDYDRQIHILDCAVYFMFGMQLAFILSLLWLISNGIR